MKTLELNYRTVCLAVEQYLRSLSLINDDVIVEDIIENGKENMNVKIVLKKE